MAIIVPYRQRDAHLTTFIQHTQAFIQRQRIGFQFFIVEQVCMHTLQSSIIVVEARSHSDSL